MSGNLIKGMKAEFGNLDQIKMLQREERKISEEKETKNFYRNLPPAAKFIDDLASIDWVFMVIDLKIKDVTEKLQGRSPIDIMVDRATGHDKAILKDFLLSLQTGYKELVKLFKRIGDVARTEQYSALLIRIKEDLKTNYKDIKA